MHLIFATLTYWRALIYYWRGGSFANASFLRAPEELQARVQLCYLAKCMQLWNEKHYRCPSFAHDLRANLVNVAVPGSGLALSFFCYFKFTAYLLVLFINPFFCFLGAVNVARVAEPSSEGFWKTLNKAYRQHLLYPDDWFSYWRLNCGLASWYWLVTRETGYDLENKWTFIQQCMKKKVPCSPCLEVPGLCIKHKNEEGGLGIHFFKNAMSGGDWLIQETMSNADSVARFLPRDAPLSTFRVMTGSRLGMHNNSKSDKESDIKGDDVFAFSCVFRAGRAGGATDHDSVLFDVDVPKKKMGVGTSNMHWYQLGAGKIATTPWLNNTRFTCHPDGNIPVTGEPIPGIDDMVKVCVDAHRALFPGVPIAGWDLCVTKSEPRMCLLEVNLMCNFFKGSFDKKKYFTFIEDYFEFLEKTEEKTKSD